MFNLKLYIIIITMTAIFAIGTPLDAQNRGTSSIQQTQETNEEEYSESALRRFEIVTLSALPFTAIHSYLGVRGIKMIRTNKIAPEMTSQNYRVMGITAVSLSLFIGVWDWLHTRNVDRSAPSVPGRKPPSPPTDGDDTDGSIACTPYLGPYTNTYNVMSNHNAPLRWSVSTPLNRWVPEPTVCLTVPLIQIRF